MSEAPERINVVVQATRDGFYKAIGHEGGSRPFSDEYVRADRIAALEAERDKFQSAWLECEGKLSDTEAERDALAAQLVEAVGVLKGLTDAMDAVDAEAERADQPGATAWSSAPVVALRYKRLEARATLAKLEAKT